MRFLIYTWVVLGLASVPLAISNAQLLNSFTSIEITLSPEYPQPGQTVRAEVTSSSENVRAFNIIWLLDGEIQEQGAGIASFTFIAGELGDAQNVGVVVESPQGQIYSKTITVQPAQVTLLWEANTYTPPFYEGRALYSSGSFITAHAIPRFVDEEGELYDASELIYTWSKNGTVLGSYSGIGRDSLVTQGPKFFGDYILSVEVTTPDNIQVARSAARVATIDPEGKLYEIDPLIGVVYHRAITNEHEFFGASQFEVQAEPFFMDVSQANDTSLLYEWSINGEDAFGLNDNPSQLRVQLDTDQDITTTIQLSIEHLRHLLQSATAQYSIVFGGSARNSLFGL